MRSNGNRTRGREEGRRRRSVRDRAWRGGRMRASREPGAGGLSTPETAKASSTGHRALCADRPHRAAGSTTLRQGLGGNARPGAAARDPTGVDLDLIGATSWDGGAQARGRDAGLAGAPSGAGAPRQAAVLPVAGFLGGLRRGRHPGRQRWWRTTPLTPTLRAFDLPSTVHVFLEWSYLFDATCKGFGLKCHSSNTMVSPQYIGTHSSTRIARTRLLLIKLRGSVSEVRWRRSRVASRTCYGSSSLPATRQWCSEYLARRLTW